MDWLRSDPYISERDTKVLKFKPGYSKVLLISQGNQLGLNKTWELTNDDEWSEWLKTHEGDSTQWSDGVCVIFAGRAYSKLQDPMALSIMPFSRATFDTIANMFWVHSSIMRVINRNTDAHCSADVGAWAERDPEATVYNCRSTASWPGDLALSATHLPARRFTFAILYGGGGYGGDGDGETDTALRVEDMMRKLQRNAQRITHPLALPLLFADAERDRHARLVGGFDNMLMQRACEFSNDSRRASEVVISSASSSAMTTEEEKEDEEPTTGECLLLSPERDSETMSQWMELYHVRNGLENWKAQLQKLAEHHHHYQHYQSELRYASSPPPYSSFLGSINHNDTSEQADRSRRCLAYQDAQIQARLRQLLLEYDEKIRRSSLIIDGMNFTTQVEWNYIARKDIKTNLDIAKSTMDTTELTVGISQAAQRDSSHMRSIAVLTMAFLPGTFVATVFSMTFFDWQASAEGMLSPYIWIFVAVTFVLTALTLAIWRCRVASEGGARKSERAMSMV